MLVAYLDLCTQGLLCNKFYLNTIKLNSPMPSNESKLQKWSKVNQNANLGLPKDYVDIWCRAFEDIWASNNK